MLVLVNLPAPICRPGKTGSGIPVGRQGAGCSNELRVSLRWGIWRPQRLDRVA